MNLFTIGQAAAEIQAASGLIESYTNATIYGIREFKKNNLASMVQALEEATQKLKEQING